MNFTFTLDKVRRPSRGDTDKRFLFGILIDKLPDSPKVMGVGLDQELTLQGLALHKDV